MPLTWDQVSAITEKKFIPKLRDNIFDSNPLLKKLKDGVELLDGGTSIMAPLGYATTTASGWFTGADTLSTADNEQITAAEYSWKQIYGNVSITLLDELKNSGDAAKINLVKSKVQMAEKTMMDTMGTAIYNDGTTVNAFVGLRAIVGTSSTVGGIAQSTNTWWAGQVDSSSTVLSIAALQTQFNAASVDNDVPNYGALTRANYNRLYALLQPQQRFQDSESAKAGFSSIMFNSCPMVADSKCPANHVFFLNLKYLHLWAHKDSNFKSDPFIKPVNQQVRTMKIVFTGALGSSNNRLHAKLSALAA